MLLPHSTIPIYHLSSAQQEQSPSPTVSSRLLYTSRVFNVEQEVLSFCPQTHHPPVQDTDLGSLKFMPKLAKYMGDEGATYMYGYISTWVVFAYW